MPDAVVITRPLAQAGPLAEKIAALGRDAIVFPLLEILPLTDPQPLRDALAELDRYAMVAFVSPNAIDAAMAVRSDWPRDLPLAVVGDGSRLALARHGISVDNSIIHYPRSTTRTDSETLLEVLDLEILRRQRVLIVRGETGREFLGDALRAAGVQVTQVAAYRRQAPVFDAARRTQLLALLTQRHHWIVTSSEALRMLLEQLEPEHLVAKMQQQSLIVPHRRIAETARTLGFRNVTLTASGDEYLLAALQSRP